MKSLRSTSQPAFILLALLILASSTAWASSWTTGSVTNAAGSRNYKLYVPSTYSKKKKLPLVLMLHGCTQAPDDFAAGTQMNEIAEKESFLVVYPEQPARANALKCWNWFETAHQARGAGEPSIIADIVKQVSKDYEVSSKRVFVVGSSAGAAMAIIMAATYPDVFAALGVHSGLAYKAATNLAEARPSMSKGPGDPRKLGTLAFEAMGKFGHRMPVIVFQGEKDSAVAPINAAAIIMQWARTNDYLDDSKANESVDAQPDGNSVTPVAVGYTYTKYIYKDHAGKLLMEKWIVQDMKHAWSGGSPKGTYTDPKGPNSSQEMWRFFKEVRK